MFYLASKLISVTTGFIFPAYSSYKAIRANDSPTIEHWLMYWVVMACLHLAENTVEWAVNWFPFYYEAKSVLILWLTLPQIQGSTYVYLSFIEPFLATHETEIDGRIAKTKLQARAAGLDYARRIWLAVRETVMRALLAPEEGGHAEAAAAEAVRPSIEAAASGDRGDRPRRDSAAVPPGTATAPAAQQAWSFANSLIKQYAPAALAAGQAVIKPLSPERSKVLARDHAARRKKDDDLPEGRQSAAAGRSRYPSELGRGNAISYRGIDAAEGQKRAVSASAALLSAAGAAGRGESTLHASVNANPNASGSNRYSSYSRQQLRQRRLELESELAALEGTSIGGGSSPSYYDDSLPGTPARRPPSPLDSIRAAPPTSERERHISAPTPPRSSSIAGNMSASLLAYDKIASDELDNVDLPNDWGRNVASKGWRGAPAGTGPNGGQTERPAVGEKRPSAGGEKRSSWFGSWGGGSSSVAAAGSDHSTAGRPIAAASGAASTSGTKGKKSD